MNDSNASTPCADSALRYSHARRSIDMPASVLMTLFCLALGLQQVAIKAVAMDISPLAQITLRSLVAALLVALLVRWRGIGINAFRTHLGPGYWWGWGSRRSSPSWHWG